MKRFFSKAVSTMMFVLVGLTGCFTETTQAQDFVEGTHYAVISPALSTQAPDGKVEVAELFWYGCPHCYALEPTIQKYLAQKPDNVFFNRVPAMLSPRWEFHAKLYYVGHLLDPDGAKDVHNKIFEALHKQHRNIDNDDQMQRFFVSLGFTNDQIISTMKSMELTSSIAHARDFSAKSGAQSVPTIIVNGKYMTGPVYVGNESLADVINFLVKKETK